MRNLNEEFLSVLSNYEGTVDDRRKKYLVDTYGYSTYGSVQNMEFTTLRNLGYTGTIDDMWSKYLQDLGGVGLSAKATLLSTTFYGADVYSVANYKPDLVFDFEQEYYRTGGTDTTFDSAMTLDRDGNATMVDSDGLLKWAPHNLLTYSEQFDNAAWSATVATLTTDVDDPEGGNTAVTVVPSGSFAYIRSTQTITAPNFVQECWLRSTDGNPLTVTFRTATVLGASVNLTSEWQLFNSGVFSGTGSDDFRVQNRSDTRSFDVAFVRVYRSDLGGMVDNPDRGDSYVPTTSAARYLPRRGHHVYNGAEWVNDGALVEPTAATNLITYSIPDGTNWTRGAVVVTENVSGQMAPDNSETLTFFREDASTGVHFFSSPSASFTLGEVYTFSAFVKKATGDDVIQLTFPSAAFGAAQYANFNTSTGIFGTVVGVATHVEDCGDGIYRIGISATATATASGITGFVLTDNNDGLGRTPSYAGDGSSGFYVWGTQLEASSTPSSYIPTSGSTVTRAADTLTVPSANLPWSSDAVSIQMEGRATGDTLTTTRWYLDANNYITQEINTSDFTFEQANAGTVDAVTGGSFTSGVNTSFNIASTHASTLVAAAVGGTALVDNTTPTALADLSSTDMALAYSGGPMILKKVRMWPANITEAGREEASV